MSESLTLGSLFDGIGGWPLAAVKYGIKPVWASEIDDFPKKVTEYHFPDMKHLGDIRQINGAEIEPVDILCAGTPCFKKGTLVSTKRGQVPIEDVKIGDEVFTHTNSYKKVLKIGKKVSDSVYALKVMGSPITRVTGNHPYYVREMARPWNNDLRRNARVFSEPKWKSVEELRKGDFVGFPINQESRNIHNLTMEECWLIGRYVADGYIRDGKRSGRINQYNHQIIFCIGKHKKDEFLKKVNEYHVGVKEDRTAYKMVIINERLVELCHSCGRGAENKEIPCFILDLPIEYLKEFLDGYMSGDGCFTNGRFSATTVSHKLAIGLQQIVHKVYRTPCKISYCERPKTCVIEGRTVNQKNTWMVIFNRITKKQNHAMYIDGTMWMPYRDKVKENGCTVYNLEVEDDHSYVANGVIVHNCQNLSVAGNRKGLGGDESSLFYEAIRILREMRDSTNGKYPKYFVWENVPGAFSSNRGNDFRVVLEEIAEASIPIPGSGKWATAGVVRGNNCKVEWRVLDAQYWGVPQRRKRIFLVASFGKKCTGEILFEPESMHGYTSESETEREGTANDAGTGTESTIWDVRISSNGTKNWRAHCYEATRCRALDTGGQNPDSNHGGLVIQNTTPKEQAIVYSFDSLSSNSMKSSNPHSGCHVTNIAKTLDTTNPDPSKNQGGIAIYDISHRCDVIRPQADGKVPCMAARYGTGGNNIPVIHVKGVTENQEGNVWESDTVGALSTGGGKPGQGYPCVRVFSDKASTLRAEAGAPKHESDVKGRLVYSLQGSMIGRDNKNGPNGSGINKNVSFTLNTVDTHAVAFQTTGFGQLKQTETAETQRMCGGDLGGGSETLVYQKSDLYCSTTGSFMKAEREKAQTLLSRDYKDPQIVNINKSVRRLTPLECERLQGLPDGYTDIEYKGKPAPDTKRYKALGNGMAQPCADFVIGSILKGECP